MRELGAKGLRDFKKAARKLRGRREGWQGGPINKVEFTLTSAATTLGDFAIGPVLISTPGPVPGAGLAGLAALALAGLYARTRRV